MFCVPCERYIYFQEASHQVFLHSGSRKLMIASTLDGFGFTPSEPIMLPIYLTCDFVSCNLAMLNFTFFSWARLNNLINVVSVSASLLDAVIMSYAITCTSSMSPTI